MKCCLCDEKAVFENPVLCKNHFIDYFEKKVLDTVKNFKLLRKSDKVVVACSGGKDSLTVLFLLHKFGFKVSALVVDEGIVGYRNKTITHLKSFCTDNSIDLLLFSFKKEFGSDLDVILKKIPLKLRKNPCTVCGTLRRYLLNKKSKGFDKLATGHGLDDECQAILMNLFKGNTDLLWNSMPITPKLKGFVQKIKPLYFCSEKEVAAYAFLNGYYKTFPACPNVNPAFRKQVRIALNDYSLKNKDVKQNIVRRHLNILKEAVVFKKDFQFCNVCGEPSKSTVCKACSLIKLFK